VCSATRLNEGKKIFRKNNSELEIINLRDLEEFKGIPDIRGFVRTDLDSEFTFGCARFWSQTANMQGMAWFHQSYTMTQEPLFTWENGVRFYQNVITIWCGIDSFPTKGNVDKTLTHITLKPDRLRKGASNCLFVGQHYALFVPKDTSKFGQMVLRRLLNTSKELCQFGVFIFFCCFIFFFCFCVHFFVSVFIFLFLCSFFFCFSAGVTVDIDNTTEMRYVICLFVAGDKSLYQVVLGIGTSSSELSFSRAHTKHEDENEDKKDEDKKEEEEKEEDESEQFNGSRSYASRITLVRQLQYDHIYTWEDPKKMGENGSPLKHYRACTLRGDAKEDYLIVRAHFNHKLIDRMSDEQLTDKQEHDLMRQCSRECRLPYIHLPQPTAYSQEIHYYDAEQEFWKMELLNCFMSLNNSV